MIQIHLVPGYGSYYYEEVATLQNTLVPHSERWFANAHYSSMTKVKELAETISIGLDNGVSCGWGDMVGVSYGGKAGRKQVFRHKDVEHFFDNRVMHWLQHYPFTSIRQFQLDWQHFLSILQRERHPAIEYGLSQAVLALLAPRGDLFQIIAKEWHLASDNLAPVPLQGSCGDNRYENADKMIYRQLDALPHSQVDQIESQVGVNGEHLLTYARWLKERIDYFAAQGITDKDYAPIIHLDVHGALGIIKNGCIGELASYLCALEEVLSPFQVRIESPILMLSLHEQLETYSELKKQLLTNHSHIQIVADEWANNKTDIAQFVDYQCVDMIHIKSPDVGSIVDIVDSVLYCKKNGMLTLLGGSCVETDISTRITTHIALVTRPDLLLVKPGMGIDEGYMLVHNEMERIIKLSAVKTCA